MVGRRCAAQDRRRNPADDRSLEAVRRLELIDLVKAAAVSAWNPSAGFTSTLGTWSGQDAALVATQTQTAFSCLAQNTAMTVAR